MPANKKHHYVPRFYLKRFSADERSINLYNFRLGRAIASVNLKNQCHRDYMYGQDGEHEKRLAVLEGAFAQLLRNIIPSCVLPPPMSPDHESLAILVLLQYARTAHTADAFDEMADGMWKAILEKDSRVSPDMLNKVRIVNTDPANLAVATMLRLYHLILDLRYKLLLAPPDREYLTSDNPVVMYNQLMEFERFGSNTGLASKGLQIFYPLSPKHLLYMYDRDVYSCGSHRDSVMHVPTDDDVLQLNTLQVASALENVYYRGPSADVFRAASAGERGRRTKKAQLIRGRERSTPTGSSQLLGMSREDVRTNLRLTFVRLLKPAKRWREERMRPGPKPAVVVRNEALIREHEAFMRVVDQGHYAPTEFLRYLRERERPGK